MKLWRWDGGRQNAVYRKFTLLFSKLLGADAYILHIPRGTAIPKHTDAVKGKRHYRFNITLRGKIWMQVQGGRVYRLSHWFSYFRPDLLVHWADAVEYDTYLFSFGWVRDERRTSTT